MKKLFILILALWFVPNLGSAQNVRSPKWGARLFAPGDSILSGSQTDTTTGNRGINSITLRAENYIGRYLNSDTLRNILIMNFSNDITKKINFLSNGNAFLNVGGTVYHPILTLATRDSGYLATNLVELKVTTQGLVTSLAEIGVAGDGEGFISGRRQGDSTATFGRFFAAWNDSVVSYVNRNEVARYDTSGLTSKRDVILNNGGNLTAPSLKFKIIDVAGGNAVDSVSVGIVAGALGVRAISVSNPIQLPSTASNTLSGKPRLLTMSGDTTIIVDNSNVINRIKWSGASAGQVLKYTGSAWTPGADNTGGGGGSNFNIRLQLANGSVQIYPDTTFTLDTLDFNLATGLSYEGKISAIQHLGTTASPTHANLTLGNSGTLTIKNSGGKSHSISATAGAFQPNFSTPNLNGSFTLATIDGGQTFTSAVWNGSVIGSAYVVHSSGKAIQDSSNARAVGDTISVPWYFTGGMSSYDGGFAGSLRFGRGATTNSNATVVGDGASGGASSTVLGKGGTGSQTSDVSIGSNTNNIAIQGTNVGTSSSITAQNGSAFGFGAASSGVRAGAFGAYSSAPYDSSIAFNTTSTGKHLIDFSIKDTINIPSGYVKANGVIVRVDEILAKAYVRSGKDSVVIYTPGTTSNSYVFGQLSDPNFGVVPTAQSRIYAKTDSIVVKAYQTFTRDSVLFNIKYVR